MLDIWFSYKKNLSSYLYIYFIKQLHCVMCQSVFLRLYKPKSTFPYLTSLVLDVFWNSDLFFILFKRLMQRIHCILQNTFEEIWGNILLLSSLEKSE